MIHFTWDMTDADIVKEYIFQHIDKEPISMQNEVVINWFINRNGTENALRFFATKNVTSY